MIPPIASRFVAGESPASAFEHVKLMNDKNVGVILNLLGEHYDSAEPARGDADAYVDLITRIASQELAACVSVKPSQIGIDVSPNLFVNNFRRIVEHAANHDVFVWCDMEGADTTDDTLDAFVDLAAEHPWTVGQCVQSNLLRTRRDLERVVDIPGKIRLVKGAYEEPPSIAHKDKSDVDVAYERDMEFLFERRDQGVAVGSHDPEMITLAREFGREYGTDYEIQMLMGVREDAQRNIAGDHVDVWQYAPYGDRWLSYFYRRIRERKENVLFAARAIAGL